MSNLFLVFDPISWFSFSLNWLSSVMLLVVFPEFFFGVKSHGEVFWNFLKNHLLKEYKALMIPLSFSGESFLSLVLFFFIMMNNFLGLFPYIFTSSSHLMFTMSLGLPLVLGFIGSSMLFQMEYLIVHFLPLGTPLVLMPVLVLIEVVSMLIRPITLSVRLAANMVAGHLLLVLLSSLCEKVGMVEFFFVFVGLVVLFVLETAVSLIQSYVFSTLSMLYGSESNTLSINMKKL